MVKLTKRQKEVKSLLEKGLTYKEIGALLNISENTVKFHCSNIYELYQVANRHELLFETFVANQTVVTEYS